MERGRSARCLIVDTGRALVKPRGGGRGRGGMRRGFVLTVRDSRESLTQGYENRLPVRLPEKHTAGSAAHCRPHSCGGKQREALEGAYAHVD